MYKESQGTFSPKYEYVKNEAVKKKPVNHRRVWDLHPSIRILPTICYEILFNDISRSRFQLNANILLNLANDGWWGSNYAKNLHLLLARERAATAGIPIIRATNNGISAWINAWGEIKDVLDNDQPHAKLIQKNIPVQPWGPPWWGVFQDVIGWLLFVIFILYVYKSEMNEKHY